MLHSVIVATYLYEQYFRHACIATLPKFTVTRDDGLVGKSNLQMQQANTVVLTKRTLHS